MNNLCRNRDLKNKGEECLRRAALWDEVKDKLQESAFSLSGGQQARLHIAQPGDADQAHRVFAAQHPADRAALPACGHIPNSFPEKAAEEMTIRAR